MKRLALLTAAALMLGGCGQKGLPKDDAQAAQYAKDEQACRAQVSQTAKSERTIEGPEPECCGHRCESRRN